MEAEMTSEQKAKSNDRKRRARSPIEVLLDDDGVPKSPLSVSQLATYLGLSSKTIYAKKDKGDIPTAPPSAISTKPLFEPLVAVALREGASLSQVKAVAEAIKRHAKRDVIFAIWRNTNVVPLPPSSGGKGKKKGRAPSGDAA